MHTAFVCVLIKLVAINCWKMGVKLNCEGYKEVKSPYYIIICCNILIATHIICFG